MDQLGRTVEATVTERYRLLSDDPCDAMADRVPVGALRYEVSLEPDGGVWRVEERVTRRYVLFDPFAGTPMLPGYTAVVRIGGRSVRARLAAKRATVS